VRFAWPLTGRTQEVRTIEAAIAAPAIAGVVVRGRGLSTRAIAERPTLSVRTVEGHIYRAMARTGTTDRDELAAMVPRTGPRA
jgi:DNA-directed RNA polymerase specialized sigma24 family protein